MNTNKEIACSVLMSGLVILSSFAGAASWEDRPTGHRNNKADNWWCSSWKKGDHVEVMSSYQFNGQMRLKEEELDKVRWWELKKKYCEAELEADLHGVCRTSTDVISGNEDGEVQMLRSFESPMSFRGIGVVGLINGLELEKRLRKAQVEFADMLEDPEYELLRREAKAATVAAVTGLIAFYTGGSGLLLTAKVTAGVEIASKLGSKLMAEARKRNLEKLAGGSLDGNGIEYKRRGWFYRMFKSNDLDKLSNAASSFNQLFNFSTFYICGNEGEQIFAKRVREGDPAWKLIVNPNNIPSDARLSKLMRELPLEDDDARARDVLSRETINVNSTLFDARKRNPGDVWLTDGSVLNGFLHQDLSGRFVGNIWMKYVADEELSLREFGPEAGQHVYAVRHLRMEREHKGQYTELKYKEDEGFELEYKPKLKDDDSKASLDVFVDKDSGYVLKVVAEMRGTDVKALPKLNLTDGFSMGKGDVNFSIRSETLPTNSLNK